MSRSSAATKSYMKKAVTPACKHCENLKLPSSHWLRSLGGAIVCPVLLSTECRYCHLAGHTVKACPELALKKTRKIEPNTHFVQIKKEVVTQTCDYQDTDSEEECGRVFPCLESSWNGKRTFASALQSKPTVVLSLVHPEKIESFEFRPFPKSPENSPPIVPFSSLVDKYKGMRWEDISDSEDELW